MTGSWGMIEMRLRTWVRERRRQFVVCAPCREGAIAGTGEARAAAGWSELCLSGRRSTRGLQRRAGCQQACGSRVAPACPPLSAAGWQCRRHPPARCRPPGPAAGRAPSGWWSCRCRCAPRCQSAFTACVHARMWVCVGLHELRCYQRGCKNSAASAQSLSTPPGRVCKHAPRPRHVCTQTHQAASPSRSRRCESSHS